MKRHMRRLAFNALPTSMKDRFSELFGMASRKSIAAWQESDLGDVQVVVVDGSSLGSEESEIDMELAAAGNIEVVRANRMTTKNLGLRDAIKDVLILLRRKFHAEY